MHGDKINDKKKIKLQKIEKYFMFINVGTYIQVYIQKLIG